jgi:hypothetical protein
LASVNTLPNESRGFARWRFELLTFLIVLYLLLAPWLASMRLLKLIGLLVLFNTLLVTISATTGRRFRRRLGACAWGLFGISVLGAIFETTTRGQSAQNIAWYIEIVVSALLQGGCAAGILIYIARAERITIDIIFAAIIAYILIAVVFASVYVLVWNLNPEAFSIARDSLAHNGNERITMLYFSLITLATLGYGDIVAIDPFARMITAIEAVTGQFYVAVLVGLLVGLYISHSTNRGATG